MDKSESSSEEEEEEECSGIDNICTEEEILAALEKNEIDRDRKWELEAETLAQLDKGIIRTNQEREAVYSYLIDNELFWFDIHEIPNDATILLIGRRRTGKSFLTRWILYNKRKVFPFGLVMTQTKYNKFWSTYIHKHSVWGDYSSSTLGRLIKRQAALVNENVWGVDPRVFVVLDDLAADSQLRSDYMLRSFFYYGRHLKAFVVVTAQWFKALSPGCRENADYIFLFGMTNVNELEAIYEEYGAGVPKDIFIQLVRRYATESSCFVVNPHGRTPFERFFQYRAQNPGPFRMGCSEMWKNE
jgi:hypothetical protein